MAVSVVIFLAMQVWGICELVMRWRLRYRRVSVVEGLVNVAKADPADPNLRTLLHDATRALLDASECAPGQLAPEDALRALHDRPDSSGQERLNPPDAGDASPA